MGVNQVTMADSPLKSQLLTIGSIAGRSSLSCRNHAQHGNHNTINTPFSADWTLKPGVDRLTFQGQHRKHALVNPAQRLSTNEPLQRFNAEGELTQGE